VVSRNQRRLLYATDTGPLLGDARAALRGTRLHAVIGEATFGLATTGIPDLPSAHMNFPLLAELRHDLLQAGVIAAATPFVATHLSLHFCPPYEESAAWLAERGILAGHDGMRVEW
jgi:adenosylcobinamide kinase/adenosylcobinamide-phosphate guanylyltransferase